MMLNKYAYDKLSFIHSMQKKTEFVIVKGNYGIGKSFIIDELIKNENLKCIRVAQEPGETHPLQPMVNAILNFYVDNNMDIDHFLKKNISFEACIRKELHDIYASMDRLIMLFESVEQYTPEFLSYMHKFVKSTCSIQFDSTIMILLEFNQDRAGKEHKNILYELELLTNPANIIYVKEESTEALEQFVRSTQLQSSALISSDIIHKLITTAFHNPLCIIRLIGYLKDRGLIYFTENNWQCKPIDNQSISHCVEDYISIRYRALEERSRDVFLKASVTGYVIDIDLLERPLSIANAKTELLSIEQQTKLLLQDDNYKFKTREVYEYISGLCMPEHKELWHGLIASYLETLSSRRNDIRSSLEDITFYCQIAMHFEYSRNYNKAFIYYKKCISVCIELDDYNMLKAVCEKMRLILHKTEYNKDREFWINYYYVLSIEKLGLFEEAAVLYKNLIQKADLLRYSRLITFIRYKRAYALYNCGQHHKAMEELKKLLVMIQKEKDYTATFVKVLDLLSAICSHIGEAKQSSRYYNWAAHSANKLQDKSHFHSLMRKSGMFYSDELAIPYLQNSLDFFTKSNDRWEVALTSYNLGTSFIYLTKYETALDYVNKSEKIFKYYNSKNIHYPLNAKGVIYAVNGDFDTSLTYFLLAHKSITEFFSDVYILINQSHCYRKLGRLDECARLLTACTEKIEAHHGNTFYLERNLAFSYAMCHYERKEYQHAMKKIEEAFFIERNKLNISSYCDLFSVHIIDLSALTSLPLSDEVLKFKDAHISDYKKHLYESKVLWGNFMFWGM